MHYVSFPHSSEDRKTPQNNDMNPTNHNDPEEPRFGMKPGCYKMAREFIRQKLQKEDEIDFAFHVMECPDCKHFFEFTSTLFARRKRIREYLRKEL